MPKKPKTRAEKKPAPKSRKVTESKSVKVEKSESGVRPILSDFPTSRLDLRPLDTKDWLEEGLTSIYASAPDAAEPDMTKIDRAKVPLKTRLTIGLIAFFAVLAATAWGGFFFFNPAKEKFTGDRVTVAIDGPAEVKSGETVDYLVRYTNDERVPLGAASLQIRLPKNFTLVEAGPTADDDGSWTLGSIAPGHDGSIRLRGMLLAPTGKTVDLQVILSYRPADFNSEFQKVATTAITVKDSVLELDLTGPPKVLPDDKVTLQIAYHNPSGPDFANMVLYAVLPETFIIESASPALAREDRVEWIVGKLSAGAEGTVSVTGSFASGAEGEIPLKARIGFLDAAGAFVIQRESSFVADVLKGDLVVLMALNGKSGDQAVNYGDTLRYAISYKNAGAVTLEDVSLTAVFETEPAGASLLQWNRLRDDEDGERSGNKLTWSKKQISSFRKLLPGDEGTIAFEIPLPADASGARPGVLYDISSRVEAKVAAIDGEVVNRMTRANPILAKLNTDASFAVSARYFDEDGVPIGSGPLPPEVGKTTTYRVTWTIKNSLHDLSDLKISAKLPPNVIWAGAKTVDAGDLSFDAGEEKMIWKLNWMPASVGTLAVNFDIAFTPSEDQAGRVPTLMVSSLLEAIDKVTGSTMLLPAAPISTALEDDPNASGKGRVAE